MKKRLDEVIICNKCGHPIGKESFPKKDYLKVVKKWGYFSKKDLQIHEFTLCEKCYDEIISEFILPPIVKMNDEAL